MAEEKQGGKIITPLGWDIKRNAKGQFVPNNEQLRKLVYDENVKLSDIDTSEITDMSYLFAFISENEEDELFDKAISFIAEFYFKREDFSGIAGWDTSKVTTFERMFYMADNFNEDISKWDTSSVTDMSCMFSCVINFNQPLDSWDTSSVTDMSFMFVNATNFNQNLSAWGNKLDKVKNMSSMFSGATSLICDFFSWWETSEICDLKDRIKNSGVEKIRDVYKKIEKTKDITVRQGIEFEIRKLRLKRELAKTLGFDEKELEIIPEPALSNFDIYQVEINESFLSDENKDTRVVKGWLVKDVAYEVYLFTI